MTEVPCFSVIVPVYNEARRLPETLPVLLDGLDHAAELIIICNGCTDGSADVARRLAGSRALVIDHPQAGKALAIREAERHVSAFPRFYVDADVGLAGRDLGLMAIHMAEAGLELISPRTEQDLLGSSWAARRVSQIWLALPHGAGAAFHCVLGLSAAGRARWGLFPDILADDSFIESQIPAALKAIDHTVALQSRPPRTLWSHIRVRARWERGIRELGAMGIVVPRVAGQRRALIAMAIDRGHMLSVALYLLVRIAGDALAHLPERKREWFQDRTSRQA